VPLWLVYDRVTWVGVLLRIASKSSTRCLFAYSKALYSRTLAPSSSQRPQFSSASRRTAGGARTHRNAPGDLGKPRGTCRSGQPTNGMAGPLMRGRKYIASVRLVRADYRVTLRLGAHMRILRREFISGLVGAAVTWPVAGRAQQTAMPVVGFLHSSSPGGYASRVAAFRQGVNEAGTLRFETSQSNIAGRRDKSLPKRAVACHVQFPPLPLARNRPQPYSATKSSLPS
jgi:hypothetical protein